MHRTHLHLRPPRPPQKLPDSLIMPSPSTLQPTAPELEQPLTMSTVTHPMTLRKRSNRNAKTPPRKQRTHRKFRLMDLPTELRRQVYHHLLSAGKVSLLRASRTVSKEVSTILFSSAFFRTVVAKKQRPSNPRSPRMIIHPYTNPGQRTFVGRPPPYHILQNVSFRIDLHLIENGSYEIPLQHLLQIVHRMRRRRCCRIVLERAAATTSLTRDFVIYFLKQFRGFEEVIVTVTHGYARSDSAWRDEESLVSKADSEIDRCVARARNRPLYDIVVCST